MGSAVSDGIAVGRIPVGLAGGGAVGRTLRRAEAVGAGAAVAEPAAAAAVVGLGDGVMLAVSCGVGLGPLATGARRWELHCNATRANTATMTMSASVDAPSAVRSEVLSESHRAFLGMASVPPCEPSPAGAFYPRPDQKSESRGPSVVGNGLWGEILENCPPRFPPPREGEGQGMGFFSASSPCWRIRSCRSPGDWRSCP